MKWCLRAPILPHEKSMGKTPTSTNMRLEVIIVNKTCENYRELLKLLPQMRRMHRFFNLPPSLTFPTCAKKHPLHEDRVFCVGRKYYFYVI